MLANHQETPRTPRKLSPIGPGRRARSVFVLCLLAVGPLALGGCSSGPKGVDPHAHASAPESPGDTVARADDTPSRADLPPLEVQPPLPPSPSPK